jgi:hypothetical protein
VKVWDAKTGQETRTLTGHAGFVESIAFSPDGHRLASGGWDGPVTVWDAGTGQEIRTLKGHVGRVHVAFSPDGKRLASGGVDGTVRVWDPATGEETRTLDGHTGPVLSVAYSPDGNRLASAGGEMGKTSEVTIWDTATGKETRALKGHTTTVIGVAYSPDGKRLASASWDGSVKVWDAATGQEIRTLKGHAGMLESVAFSPDGHRLASGGGEEIKVWDVGTGQETLTLKEHAGWVASVAFSPDGQRLASAGDNGTMKVWDATPITPESLARDDALSLIRFLLERVTSEAELRDRIAGDKAISTETRAAALKLAEGFWATRIRRQAESLVSPLFDRLLVRAEVLDSVRADPTINPEVRADALALAETWPEPTSAWDLNNSAWALVKRPNRPEADSRRGLRLAERACQLEPNNGAYLNTLGVAKYRMGQYEKSQATLTQSNRLNGNRGPADLAFLAMTQHRLHQVEAARATFQRLREVMKDPRIAANAENQGFLREVESAIPNSPEQPKDVLAPQRY